MENGSKGRILVVDDDQSILRTMKLLLKDEFDQVKTISNPKFIPNEFNKGSYEVVLLDMNFTIGNQSGKEGLFWMSEIKKRDPSVEVIMITAYGDINLAVQAIKLGATDFVVKPWENAKLIATLQSGVRLCRSNRRVDRLKHQQSMLHEENNRRFSFVPGNSENMLEVLNVISKVAATDANVLILGENGTGKEIVARELHNRSSRKEHVFMAVDLGSLSEGLFESELFGHVKGAFTGAYSDKPGRFEASYGGTLFLDEIGNLPLSLQGKLLTAIQQKRILPLGSAMEKEIDLRLICATNQPIREMVKDGLFREDLLYRINTVEINVPPLRERGDDIIRLAEHFLLKFSKKYDKPGIRFTTHALQKLKKHVWPGNVRELQHAVERAVILSRSNSLHGDDFNFFNARDNNPDALKSIEEIEKYYISRSLEQHRGKLTKVAEEMNLSRQTIYRKVRKYGL